MSAHLNVSLEDIKTQKRSARSLAYESHMADVSDALNSSDPKFVAAKNRANAGFMHAKAVGPLTVHQNSTLSNVSIQYANDEYIGDQLMPAVKVAKKSDVYYIYDKRNRLAYPPDELGPRGQANEVSESRSTTSYLCKGFGYENYVDGETLANQDAPLDEMVDLVEAVNEGLAFRRELRIATIMTTAGNFPGQTAAIAAGSRWDTASGGNPIKDIQDALKACWTGRGPGDFVGYCSYDVALVLSRHPAILDLFKYGGTAPGLATMDMVAGFFGLSKILVGKARKDTANEGQTASYSRIWSDVFGIARVARRPTVRNASFGYTFQHSTPQTITWFDQRAGVKGGWYAKVSTSEDSKIVASDTGYLLTTPIN